MENKDLSDVQIEVQDLRAEVARLQETVERRRSPALGWLLLLLLVCLAGAAWSAFPLWKAEAGDTQERLRNWGQRVQIETEKRLQPVTSRLAGLEFGRQTDKERLTQLESELAGLRQKMARQIAEGRKPDTGRDWSATTHERRLDRVDFEIPPQKDRELAPGIHMQVTSVDSTNQRVSGRLRLTPEGHVLPVREQGIQNPLIFYTSRGDRPHEIVFTRVTKNQVAGYLLIPRQSENSAPAPSSPEKGGSL